MPRTLQCERVPAVHVWVWPMIILCPAIYTMVQVWVQLSLYFVLLATSVRLRKAADYTWTQCSWLPEVPLCKAVHRPQRCPALPKHRGDKRYFSSEQRPEEAQQECRTNMKGWRWRRQVALHPDWAHLPEVFELSKCQTLAYHLYSDTIRSRVRIRIWGVH